MLLTILLLFIPLTYAQSGPSLTIVHPRNPSQQKDIYSIKCNKECDIKVTTASKRSGTSKLTTFDSKIDEVISIATNEFPVAGKLLSHQILYSIQATSGDKKVDVILGYPKGYLGADYQKYSDLIVKIEEIKREIISNTTEVK